MDEKVKTDQLKDALDLMTKLEVLKAVEERLPYKNPKLKIDKRDVDFDKVRELAKKPLKEETIPLHSKNVEDAIYWLEKKAEEVRGAMVDNKPQMLVQLDAAWERAQSLMGHLKRGNLEKAKSGLQYLASWHLKS